MIILSMSFLLWASVRASCGSALDTRKFHSRNDALGTYEESHLILGTLLEKHEDEYNQRERSELTQLWVDVPRRPLKRKWNLLDESTGHVDESAYEGKLETKFNKSSPLGLGLVELWCNLVEPVRRQERKDETQETYVRNSKKSNNVNKHHLLLLKKKEVVQKGRGSQRELQ